jgi:hypothetical protein
MWGGLVFIATAAFVALSNANDIYSSSVENRYERLSPSTVEEIKSHESALRLEFALRSLSSEIVEGNICYSNREVCQLANEMEEHETIEGWGSQIGSLIASIGLITAIFAMLSVELVSFFARTSDTNREQGIRRLIFTPTIQEKALAVGLFGLAMAVVMLVGNLSSVGLFILVLSITPLIYAVLTRQHSR